MLQGAHSTLVNDVATEVARQMSSHMSLSAAGGGAYHWAGPPASGAPSAAAESFQNWQTAQSLTRNMAGPHEGGSNESSDDMRAAQCAP
jgi:hypothetical protein